MKLVDDDGKDVERGRGRRDRHPRRERDEGLLGPRRGDRGGHPGRLVPLRRHGQAGRGRLLLHRRPQEGPDHPRRLQRLPARGRGGALRARGGRRGRRHRHPGRRASARRSAPPSRSRTAATPTRRSCRPSPRSGWPPTSTPAAVWIVDELPKGPTGKILRREVSAPRRPSHERRHQGRGPACTRSTTTRAPTPPRRSTCCSATPTRSPIRRFLPGMSGVRFTANLARRPARVAGRTLGLAAELAKVGVGRSELEPHEKDRRFAEEALGQEPAVQAHPAGLPRDGGRHARPGRRRRARLGRRAADGLHRRQPRRGVRAEQQPVPEPQGAQAGDRHRRRQPGRGRSPLRPRLRDRSAGARRWSSRTPSRSARTSR